MAGADLQPFYYSIEDNLDFAAYGNLSTKLAGGPVFKNYGSLDGKNFEFKNITIIDSESNTFNLISVTNLSNLRFSNVLMNVNQMNQLVSASLTATNIHFKDSQLIGSQMFSFMRAGTITSSSVTNSVIKGGYDFAAFNSARIYGVLVDAQVARNGVPGTGMAGGLVVGNIGVADGLLYNLTVRGKLDGVFSGGGIAGGSSMCISHADVNVDVVGQDTAGGIAGSMNCSEGPYSSCGVEYSTYTGSVYGKSGVGGLVSQAFQMHALNNQFTGAINGSDSCGGIAGVASLSGDYRGNVINAAMNCVAAASGSLSGTFQPFDGPKTGVTYTSSFWPNVSGNSIAISGSVPTKKFGSSSVGDPP